MLEGNGTGSTVWPRLSEAPSLPAPFKAQGHLEAGGGRKEAINHRGLDMHAIMVIWSCA